MWNLKNNVNKAEKTHRYRELRVPEGRLAGGWVKKVKGLRSTNW